MTPPRSRKKTDRRKIGKTVPKITENLAPDDKHLTENIMGKGKDTKKNVKKEATKTPKEKKVEKRLKKSK